jgi:TPP-dependent indolepyruvate ferredoxin oxidoreductase alpha subunit
VIASGVAYTYAKEALGTSADFLKLGMIWPLPSEKISAFARRHKKVYVIEELDPFIEEFCASIGLDVQGKDIFTLQGEYSVNRIRERLLGEKTEAISPAGETPVRPPEDPSVSCRYHCICPPGTRKCTVRRDIPGSTAFVPSVAGLIMAGEVVKDLAGLG